MIKRRSFPIPVSMLIFWAMGWCGVGCAPHKSIICPKPYAFAFPGAAEEEISRLEEALTTRPDTRTQAGHLWKLAIFYSHPDNPRPDYPKAAERMQALAGLSVAGLDPDRVRYMASVLKTLGQGTLELKNIQKKISSLMSGQKKVLTDTAQRQKKAVRKFESRQSQLKEEIENLKSMNQKLEYEVRSLEEKLDSLKTIDLQLEEIKRN